MRPCTASANTRPVRAPMRCSRGSRCRTARMTKCATSPAARCGASKLPARSCIGPACLCSTSRRSVSTSNQERISWATCVDWSSKMAPRCCGPPISSTKSRTTWTSSSCTKDGFWRMGPCHACWTPPAQGYPRSVHAPDARRRRRNRGLMTVELAKFPRVTGFAPIQYAICLKGIVWREGLRFLHQRERFVAALVRPLVWLFIFAAGFRQVLGVSIIPPYETYVLYEVYITPGLMLLIQLFNGMQSSLSMVYDREMGNMRTLLVSPMPRWFLLSSKLVAGMAVSLPQVYTFLAIAWFWEIEAPPLGYIAVLPALILSGLMLGALGMLMSSVSKQLENFAGAMNFVIFPMFFASSALYPLWRVREGSPFLYYICQLNPFTHAVELVRFALYAQVNWISLAVVSGCTALFMVGAILAYDPARGLLARRGEPGGGA